MQKGKGHYENVDANHSHFGVTAVGRGLMHDMCGNVHGRRAGGVWIDTGGTMRKALIVVAEVAVCIWIGLMFWYAVMS